jgi:hypothetical protein
MGIKPAALPAYTAANAVMLDHLDGDDYRLFKAKAAITGAAAYLDPIKWDALEPGQRIDRRVAQQSWLEDDLEIGDQIQSGDYAGMYVGEIIVPGGKYPSVEGGFRPAFASGGTGEDGIRNISAGIGGLLDSTTGAFAHSTAGVLASTGTGRIWAFATFHASRVVPTADDNRVKTIAERVWRRVA